MWTGGAIQNCNGLIQNNIFENNHANFGGALANCHGTIQNNLFFNNTSQWANPGKPGAHVSANKLTQGYGGAIYNCNGLIRNNTIVDNYRYDNTGPQPGALYGCKGTIVNNIIYHTTMTQAAEMEGCATPAYNLFRTAVPGQGNIAGDPKFVNPAAHDYRLQPGSPAIDAGKGQVDLKADFSGVQRGLKAATPGRGDGSGADIGAFEALPKPVALWLPDGGPPEINEGDALSVRWEMVPPASAAIRLRLYAGGLYLSDLGRYESASGSAAVKLPKPLATRTDYSIMGISIANAEGISYTSSTPPLAIHGMWPSAVSHWNWQAYF